MAQKGDRSGGSDVGNGPILDIRDLCVYYGPIQVIDHLTFQVQRHAVTTILGANGAGKTTILKTISGLLPAKRGHILFNGYNLDRVPAHERVARGLCQCPEGRGIFPMMSVEENLELGAYLRAGDPTVKNDFDLCYELFPRLRERRSQGAGTLSGGEQQMLAMARALMAKPQVLLLDEPSLGLAPQMIELIFETISRIVKQGVSVLLVEQNALMALQIAHRALVIESGRLVAEDSAQVLIKSDLVRKAYLGE